MCIQDLLPCTLLAMKMSHISFIQLQLLFKINYEKKKKQTFLILKSIHFGIFLNLQKIHVQFYRKK